MRMFERNCFPESTSWSRGGTLTIAWPGQRAWSQSWTRGELFTGTSLKTAVGEELHFMRFYAASWATYGMKSIKENARI